MLWRPFLVPPPRATAITTRPWRGLGEHLQAVGFADDGTVEAVEVKGSNFAMGVQWHPEDNATDDRLFAALVVAAAQYRSGRRDPDLSHMGTTLLSPTER